MRTYDFTPFSRSTIGFERLFDRLNNMQWANDDDSYPPYDIVRTGEDSFRISLAVAGFSIDDLSITSQQNMLTVAGRKPDDDGQDYLYQGISARAFERRFELADHIEVESAAFVNGLLQIALVRRVPDAVKPRRIDINNVATLPRRGKQVPENKVA
jgi:molecular chaperone IbpA